MANRTFTHLKGCEVEIFEIDEEGSWTATIIAAFVDLDVAFYEVEIEDGSRWLIPQQLIRRLKLVSGRQSRQLKMRQKNKPATILNLLKS